MNQISEPEAVTEVPESLKRLVRIIIRGFYEIEHALIVDLLIHHPCIKEDDLVDLLKFERKHLRTLLNTLKTDKFIKTRLRMESDGEKLTKHSYYFINYSVFVNVVKYKLDQMRRKIETEERDSTSRASFLCDTCNTKYTDLDAGDLFDYSTQQMVCTYCKNTVEMESTSSDQMDARMLMARYNEQLEPIFALLREVEDVKLAPELLDPEPTDLKSIRSQGAKARSGGEKEWRTNAKNYGYGTQENEITISLGGEGKGASNAPAPKEQPQWMRESTVQGAVPDGQLRPASVPVAQPFMDETSQSSQYQNDEVMQVLLTHEKKGPPPLTGALAAPAASDDESSTSESGDEMRVLPSGAAADTGDVDFMNDDDEEDHVVTVTVAGKHVPLDEVTEDMVAKMNPAERAEYIRVSQEMYQDMYE